MLPDAVRTLDQLPVGAEAEVAAVRGPRALARRLMEMGVLPGTALRVVRVAPLGDPIEIRLRSYALSIRRAEATGIEITNASVPAPAGAPALSSP